MIYNNIKEMIGNTPLLKVSNYSKYNNLSSDIYVKLEGFNPTGSVKDRAVLEMITDLESKNIINKETIIIEATSGNTGISIASIARYSNYKVIIVMPENMSIERRKILSFLGAEVILTKKELGMNGAINKAIELNKEIENSIILNQFENYNNVLAHYKTAKEIIDDIGDVDCIVMGVGTGGTITGISKYFKANNISTRVIAVEPKESNVLSGGKKGRHEIEGIGAGFIPPLIDMKLIDEIITVNSDEALNEAKIFSKTEGIMIGISSGAALAGLKKLNNNYKKIVVILPDLGFKYLSTRLYE